MVQDVIHAHCTRTISSTTCSSVCTYFVLPARSKPEQCLERRRTPTLAKCSVRIRMLISSHTPCIALLYAALPNCITTVMWSIDCNQWGRSRSPKMLSIALVYYYTSVCTKHYSKTCTHTHVRGKNVYSTLAYETCTHTSSLCSHKRHTFTIHWT